MWLLNRHSKHLTVKQLQNMTHEELNRHMLSWDEEKWKEEVNSKTSIGIYRKSKLAVQEETIYDNTPSSSILFQARTNTLRLNDRKKICWWKHKHNMWAMQDGRRELGALPSWLSRTILMQEQQYRSFNSHTKRTGKRSSLCFCSTKAPKTWKERKKNCISCGKWGWRSWERWSEKHRPPSFPFLSLPNTQTYFPHPKPKPRRKSIVH